MATVTAFSITGRYNQIQQALEEALRQARRPRPGASGRGSRYNEADISIDVTPATKQFSIVAAIASFGPEGRFLYIDNSGTPRSCNIALRLAGGLIGD